MIEFEAMPGCRRPYGTDVASCSLAGVRQSLGLRTMPSTTFDVQRTLRTITHLIKYPVVGRAVRLRCDLPRTRVACN